MGSLTLARIRVSNLWASGHPVTRGDRRRVRTEIPRETRDMTCLHDFDAHEHYRPGSECSLCPEGVCPSYSRHRLTYRARIIRWLAGRNGWRIA